MHQARASENCSSSLRALQKRAEVARLETEHWANIWGVTWSAATVAQFGVAAAVKSRDTREDLILGGVSSSLGLIPTWIVPPAVTRLKTDAIEAQAGPDDVRDDCAALALLEAELSRAAKNDEANTGVWAHASNVAVNLAVSLVMGAGFGHWNSAGVSAVVGIPVGELMILTYPRAAAQFRGDMSHVSVSWVPGQGSQAVLLQYDF